MSPFLVDGCNEPWVLFYYCDMMLSQVFYPMEAQLSLKAVLPLTAILTTASDRYGETGPSGPFY